MQCPTCQGPTWDNRAKKASGEFKAKSPDFSCKNKACGGAIWPEKKEATVTVMAEAPSGNGAYSWPELGATYARCHEYAKRIVGDQEVVAATATLFIQATKLGLKARPKGAPPVAPPPPPPIDTDDDLPF